ncbi:flagellar hook-basal body complex protein [Sphingomonas sp. BT-65]|uniref:flagellar hook basal-body protein n=1 Tax=Sphingomonas sp. BT-65 TaxID=2989821 RepID=UPI002235DA99|nr:flagellar hook basal-body protein [Sphingomonas sp. BT-65]MCW4463786.1 flagellar hook-basal body complex protein [Sphingomonas sp. BT-65]
MSGLVESALAILAGAGDRTRLASENIGNMTTPGYKARRFQAAIVERTVGGGEAEPAAPQLDFAQGPLRATGNKYDLALQGEGFFVVAAPNGELYYTRQGQFDRAEDGRLLSPGGYTLQQAGGGDLVVAHDRIEITQDGTALDAGQPIGQVALAVPEAGVELVPVSGSTFAAPPSGMNETAVASVRQGMLEGANTSLGDEMLSLMTATRQAEAGARLVQVYDELMGRAFTTLGQRG